MYKYLINKNLISLIKKLIAYLEEEQMANKLLSRLQGIVLADEATRFNADKELYLLEYMIKHHSLSSHLKLMVIPHKMLGIHDIHYQITILHNIYGVILEERGCIYYDINKQVNTYTPALRRMIDKIVKDGLDFHIDYRKRLISGPPVWISEDELPREEVYERLYSPSGLNIWARKAQDPPKGMFFD